MSEDRGLHAESLPLPPADAPTPLAQAAFGLGGMFVIFAIYILASAACFFGMLQHPRLAIAVSQAAGLLLPAVLMLLVAERLELAPRAPAWSRDRLAAQMPAILLYALATFLVTLAVGVTWMGLLKSTGWEWVRRAEEMLAQGYGPFLAIDRPRDVLVILVTLSIVPAICEEVAFRGFLQRMLQGAVTPGRAVVVTSVLFAGMHLDVLGLVPRLFIGLSLGLLYLRTGRLLPCMIVHAVHNLSTLLIAPWSMEDPAVAIAGLDTTLTLMAALGAVPVAAVALVLWAHAWRLLGAGPVEPGAA